jgi:serine/threonine protein kinase
MKQSAPVVTGLWCIMKQEYKYIGNYRILDVIGKGGMAKIYTAIHSSLDRIVVIKEMGKNESRRRFKQEAMICASLDHRNIVPIYDYFSIGSSCYIVMQYVDGVDLAQVIERAAPLEPKIVAYIAREICCALQHAHQSGIIHRDVKPTNILISRTGEVKITDFGVARGEDMPHLTSTGQVIGTPFYMSPEQAEGKEVTSQSDIYSIGIVMYEMITGKRPFTGDNVHGITAKIIRGKYPSPLWNSPYHSLRLSSLIQRAMSKTLSRRYASIERLVHDLSRFIGNKRIVHGGEELVDLLQSIEQEQRATTIVRKPDKKKSPEKKRSRKKQKPRQNIPVLVILLVILSLLIYYLIHIIT